MCLITDQKEPLVALKDIVVYKLLYEKVENQELKLFSVVRYYEWKRGKLYSTIMKFKQHPASPINPEGYVAVENGFHAMYKDTFGCWICSAVYKAIIPKGALYFIGRDKEDIVSNEMILGERLRDGNSQID
jgi:hypothetical protein